MRRIASIPVLSCILALAALAAYANHFQNTFHFDDFQSVTENVFIRDLRNVPRFFTGAAYSSTVPGQRMYRPLVSASLALDYRLGGGLNPVWFHAATFLLFEAQLILMFLLFRRLMDCALPGPWNLWTAFFAALCYGLHPANAETVNYIFQRAGLYGTLGVVAGLLWFAARPRQRHYGWYLIPPVLAYLSTPAALVFPLILVFYLFLFEQDGTILGGDLEARKTKWAAALRGALPAFVVTAVFAVIEKAMTPAGFQTGAQSAWMYRITQPFIALHYFKSFFLPTELSADTDWNYVRGPFSTDAVLGFAFVAALAAAAVWTSRRRETRPIAFGLLWFLLALAPTSLMPLAEVTADHRMFFPFVGLALAVFWALRLLLVAHPAWLRAALAALALVLVAEAVGAHQRNNVWRTEETLWRDVVEKSPQNGRGLMNYGLALMSHGNSGEALSYFEKARMFTPNYPTLEINLGVANGALHLDRDAESHFQRALMLAPESSDSYFYYARWLHESGQDARSAGLLKTALGKSPGDLNVRHLLIEEYAAQNNLAGAQTLARETLQLAPGDDVAPRFLSGSGSSAASTASLTIPPVHGGAPLTADQLIGQSLDFYNSRQYFECILSAMKALKLRPDIPEAYNNIAAANNAMGRWDEGIRNAREALRLKPDFTVARNNLQLALDRKQKQQGQGR
jgi:protein O-mannosyl-transferase